MTLFPPLERSAVNGQLAQPFHKPALAFPYKPSSRKKTSYIIRNHANKPGHKMVISTLEKRILAKLHHLFIDKQRRVLTNEEIDLGVTANHVRVAFNALCKHNVALDAYEVREHPLSM